MKGYYTGVYGYLKVTIKGGYYKAGLRSWHTTFVADGCNTHCFLDSIREIP